MSTKHDIVIEICKNLGISPDPKWFSSGSTITRDSLNTILSKVEKIDKDFDFITKPIPNNLRTLFIKFVRGFEDYYSILKSEEVLIKTEVIKNGKIGINIVPVKKRIDKEIKKNDFDQWIYFVTTGDPIHIESFIKLEPAQKALILLIRRQQFDNLLQNQLLKITQGNLDRAMQTSGLLSGNVSVNNYISISPQMTATAHADSKIINTKNFVDNIAEALDNNDNSALKKLLEQAAKEEKKSPGFLRNIFQKSKGPIGNILMKSLLTWITKPENVAEWPKWIKLIEEALTQ